MPTLGEFFCHSLMTYFYCLLRVVYAVYFDIDDIITDIAYRATTIYHFAINVSSSLKCLVFMKTE